MKRREKEKRTGWDLKSIKLKGKDEKKGEKEKLCDSDDEGVMLSFKVKCADTHRCNEREKDSLNEEWIEGGGVENLP